MQRSRGTIEGEETGVLFVLFGSSVWEFYLFCFGDPFVLFGSSICSVWEFHLFCF